MINKKYCFIYITLLLCLPVLGQNNLSLVVKPGVSKIKSSSRFYFNSFYLSGNIGFNLNFAVAKKLSLTSGIYYNRMEGLEKSLITFTDDNGMPLGGELEFKYFRHLNYLSVPLLFGYETNKIGFRLGIQPQIVLGATYETKHDPFEFQSMVIDSNGKARLNIDAFDIGAVGEIYFKVNQKLRINFSHYFGINNIAPQNSDLELLNRQFFNGDRV